MPEEYQKENHDEQVPFSGFIERLEKEFDWNLIGVVSIWLFLFATFFLIFVKP